MARITAKQAKEMNEAYAKVYQNLQEYQTRGTSSSSQARQKRINALLADKNKANVGSGEKVTVEKGEVTDRQSSAGSTSGGGGNSGGSAGGGSTQKRSVSPLTQKRLDKQAAEAETNRQASEIEKKNPGALNRSFAGAIKNNNNNQSSGGSTGGGGSYRFKPGEAKNLGNQLKNQSGDKVQSGGGQPTQEPGVKTSRTVVKDGNRTTTTTRRSADSSTPAGAAAVAKEKSAFADRMAARRAARDGNTGGGGQAPQQGKGQAPSGGARAIGQKIGGAIGGGIDRGINRAKGGLSRLGALAGKAVGAAKSAAGAVASGAKRVAGGVADAATGNMTDFDKRGGKPQGLSRVVAGGVDKLTGDRTDLDKRGVTPLNAGQRAQFQKKPVAAPAAGGQAQAKPAATRPVQGQQPAAKPVVTQQQPAKRMGQTERQNRARFGNEKVDALKAKNAQFQAARKSGNLAQYRKDNPKMSGADRAKAMAKARLAAKPAPVAQKQPGQGGITRSSTWDSYDPVFDDTVQFLVSEGHAKDVSEAMSIMSETEFIDAFNQEING